MSPIATRMLRLGLPLAVLVIVGAVLTEVLVERNERSLLELRQNSGLDLALNAFLGDVSSAVSDLAVVSSFEEVEPALDAGNAAARARLARDFLTFARSKRVYDQVRLLGSDGREIVRVNYRNGRAAQVPEAELQDKNDRVYFKDAVSLDPGAISVSSLDLNVENGIVTEPLVPTLRFATPILDSRDKVSAVVVLNYMAQRALDELKEASNDDVGTMLLVDRDGTFLKGRTSDEEWSGQIPARAGRTFQASFPNAWRAIQAGERGDVTTEKGSFSYRTIRPGATLDVASRETWKLVSLVPTVAVVALQRRFLGVVAIVTFLFLGAIGGGVFTAASQQIRTGESERRAFEHLQEAEQRYRLLFERNQAGVYRSTLDGTLLECNEGFLRLFGFQKKEDALARRMTSLYADSRDRARQIDRLLVERKATSEEVLFRRVDGKTLWVHASISLVEGAGGGASFLEGALVDVDERRRAVDALKASETRTRALLENMLGGLIMVNETGAIEFANPAAERMFGFAAGELIGKPLATLVPAREGVSVGTFLREALTKAIGRVSEWEGQRKNGDVFPFELALFQFETPEGRRFAGSVVDVTERREVDRLKREFVSSISHELRTPLTSIRGSLGLLAGGVLGPLSPDASEIVAVAERNVVRLIGLINDILDLERLEGGRLEMEFKPVDADPIVVRALEAVQTFADESRVLLVSEASGVRVRADADRLVQVLVNLVSNAVKFSPPGGTVRLSVVPGTGTAEFRVDDQGRGVPPMLRELIFERYRQVEASDSRSKGGAGLGLAICKSIVEQHGGTIGVRAAPSEGTGSTFWFQVPLVVLNRPSLAGNIQTPRGLALLVDDDEELLSILELRLAQDRVATQRATTAGEAIAAAFALKPDLIVLDLGLPDGDGTEVVEALRRDPWLRDIALLVYTGRDLRQEDRDRLVLGPTRFLTKSRETEDEFRSLVLELLSLRREATT